MSAHFVVLIVESIKAGVGITLLDDFLAFRLVLVVYPAIILDLAVKLLLTFHGSVVASGETFSFYAHFVFEFHDPECGAWIDVWVRFGGQLEIYVRQDRLAQREIERRWRP
jgi:hypothetical protein